MCKVARHLLLMSLLTLDNPVKNMDKIIWINTNQTFTGKLVGST